MERKEFEKAILRLWEENGKDDDMLLAEFVAIPNCYVFVFSGDGTLWNYFTYLVFHAEEDIKRDFHYLNRDLRWKVSEINKIPPAFIKKLTLVG